MGYDNLSHILERDLQRNLKVTDVRVISSKKLIKICLMIRRNRSEKLRQKTSSPTLLLTKLFNNAVQNNNEN